LKLPNGKALTGSNHTRPLVGTAQERAFLFHTDSRVLAEPSRNLVPDPLRQGIGRRPFHLATTAPRTIDAFINAENQDAHPFEWTKQVVHSQDPRAKYADLRK
jgi:hypothetical protein